MASEAIAPWPPPGLHSQPQPFLHMFGLQGIIDIEFHLCAYCWHIHNTQHTTTPDSNCCAFVGTCRSGIYATDCYNAGDSLTSALTTQRMNLSGVASNEVTKVTQQWECVSVMRSDVRMVTAVQKSCT